MIGGEPAALPSAVAEVFDFRRSELLPLLVIPIAGIKIACHFFVQDEIEFDFDPREITGPDRFDALLKFLTELAQLTAKPAVLTPENGADKPIFRAAPLAGLVEYVAV